MAFKEEQFYDSYPMNGLPGNLDYVGYPYWFNPHHVFTAIKSISGLKPVHSQIIMGKTIFRRNSREYQLQSVFFNSYKSIKTTPWLFNDSYRRTPDRTDYARWQHFFWYQPATRKRRRHTGLLFISKSVVEFNRKEYENRYRRVAYKSYFAKPPEAPAIPFTPTTPPGPSVNEPDDWNTIPGNSTTWTDV